MRRKFDKDHRKSVVPKDDYMATIVHGNFDFDKPSFYLWWVIDTGRYMHHKISQEFPCSEGGERILQRTMKRLKVSYMPGVEQMISIFPLQFIGKRGKISVDIKHTGDFTRNIITYHQPALAPPEENVIKSRSVDHFFEEKSGRKLPLL